MIRYIDIKRCGSERTMELREKKGVHYLVFPKIEELGIVVIHPQDQEDEGCTTGQIYTLLDERHIQALIHDFAARRTVALDNRDDHESDVDTPNPGVSILLRQLAIFICLYILCHNGVYYSFIFATHSLN